MIALAFLPAGCAPRDIASLPPGIESRGSHISGVPFVRQGVDDCGPAALAGVLAFYGVHIPLDEISARVMTPALRGTLPPDMENFARAAGFRAEASSGTLSRLQEEVRSGRPVICLIDLGRGIYRQPHYVIVTGFDEEMKMLIMHDGQRPERLMSYDRFLKSWGRAGNWMLVILPAGGPA